MSNSPSGSVKNFFIDILYLVLLIYLCPDFVYSAFTCLTCKGNTTYVNSCGFPCPRSCGSPKYVVCNRNCFQPRCECKPGYVLNSKNKCILESDCPKKPSGPEKCKKNAEFVKCTNPCPQVCGIQTSLKCNKKCGKPGCQCKPGFILDTKEECISLKKCKEILKTTTPRTTTKKKTQRPQKTTPTTTTKKTKPSKKTKTPKTTSTTTTTTKKQKPPKKTKTPKTTSTITTTTKKQKPPKKTSKTTESTTTTTTKKQKTPKKTKSTTTTTTTTARTKKRKTTKRPTTPKIPKCQENEEYSFCTSVCPRVCGVETSKKCPKSCGPPGCQCKSGFIRNFVYDCISEEECHASTKTTKRTIKTKKPGKTTTTKPTTKKVPTKKPQKCSKNKEYRKCYKYPVLICSKEHLNSKIKRKKYCKEPKCVCADEEFLYKGKCLSKETCKKQLKKKKN
uniref:TIL domain-containing protein n=1 Tax=Strongyloides venezuelensis TaxID=75913 RepID=A0A0K0FAA5_STRVS